MRSRLLLGSLLLLTPLAVRAAAPVEGLILPFQQVAVSTRVAGLVESVAVKEGDAVTAGQLLAQLADAEEKLEAERAARVVDVKTYDSSGTQELLQKDMVRKDETL